MTEEDSEKLKRLYEIYEQPMYRIAFAILHKSELAEDAVSEAFIRIIKILNRIGSPESEETKHYIVKVIRSTSINQYRKNRCFYAKNLPIDDETTQLPDVTHNVEDLVIERQFGNMFTGLNDADHRILVLRYKQELSWRDVAQSLSITEGSARKRFERIKKRLTNMKGEMDDEKKEIFRK